MSAKEDFHNCNEWEDYLCTSGARYLRRIHTVGTVPETLRCLIHLESTKNEWVACFFVLLNSTTAMSSGWKWLFWIGVLLLQIISARCNRCHVGLILLWCEKWPSWFPRSYNWVSSSINIPQRKRPRENKCHPALNESHFHILLNQISALNDCLLNHCREDRAAETSKVFLFSCFRVVEGESRLVHGCWCQLFPF